MALVVFLLKSKCFKRCLFWPHISNITAFYPVMYWQDSQLLPEAQRASTAMWSLKGHRNSKKAVDIARCQCEQQVNITSALAEYSMSVWIRAGEWLLPIFLCLNMQQTTVRNSCNEMFVWSCSLPFLFAFHFPIACILSVTFDALLNSINSIKLRILHLSVPAPCEKCCRVASCGAAIPAQAEGPLLQLPSALCPSGGIQAFAGPSSALKPVSADLWGKWGLCVGREDKQSSHMQRVLNQSLPYFNQARGSGGGNSALTRAQRGARALGECRGTKCSCSWAVPQPGDACSPCLLVKWELTPVQEEVFGLTGVSKAWDQSCSFTAWACS